MTSSFHPYLLKLAPMFGFGFRTWIASMLALYVAFFFQLDSPHWAWLTVWIVSQPSPGMMLSKGLYRLIGSLTGAFLGIVLIAFFAQTPILFVFGLALLASGCTIASNLLTNFRAYATVLAAYTAGIVAAGAIDNPSQVFYIAAARGSCIALGIASSLVVTAIFAPHRANGEVRAKIKTALTDISARAALPWQEQEEIRNRMGSKLIQDIMNLNTLVEYASAESAEFRLQATNARSLLAHLFGVISARRAMDAHLRRVGWPSTGPLDNCYKRVNEYMLQVPSKLERGEIRDLITTCVELRADVAAISPEHMDELPIELLTSQRLILDRLEDLLKNWEGVLDDWKDIVEGKWDHTPRLTLNFHRDQRAAYISGIRAFLAVMATGIFWIQEAWSDGPNALIFVTIMLTLFSTTPHPDRVGWAFFKFGVMASITGIFCKFWILSMNSNFEFLVIGLGGFLIPMGMLMANPKTAAGAVSFSLVFLNLVAPANPMQFDFTSTLNTALSILVGVLFGTLAYQVIFPPNPAAARRYVTLRIRLGLQLISGRNPIPPKCSWETRMYDRVQRLHDPENLSGTPTDEWLEAGLGALILGLEILRLRQRFETNPMPAEIRASIDKIVSAFRNFLQAPCEAAAEVDRQYERLLTLEPGEDAEDRKIWARVLGTVTEMRDFLDVYPLLLDREDLHRHHMRVGPLS